MLYMVYAMMSYTLPLHYAHALGPTYMVYVMI